jgi:hypothetical protein
VMLTEYRRQFNSNFSRRASTRRSGKSAQRFA